MLRCNSRPHDKVYDGDSLTYGRDNAAGALAGTRGGQFSGSRRQASGASVRIRLSRPRRTSGGWPGELLGFL